ncbi:MAG: carboxypeptidase-like regulatory domain-containing protein, partial [Planctomycetia bacterium]
QIVDEAPLELVVASPVEYLQPVIEYDADERRVAATVKPIDGAGRIPPTRLRLELPAAAVKQGNLEAEISTERPTARLTADLTPDAVDENVEVWLHAAEVPRAFRFQTGASLPRGTPLLEPYLDVTAPADGTKFLIAELGPRLPIGLQADGANGAAAGLNALNAAVGFDRDRDGEGEEEEQLAAGVFGDGRSVVVTAAAPVKGTELSLKAAVADVTLSLPVGGTRGRQTLFARLRLPAGDRRPLVERRTLFFLAGPPAVEIVRPADDGSIVQGDDWAVELKCDGSLAGAVDSIAVGLDRNKNGKLDDDETLPPLGRSADETIRFPASTRRGADDEPARLTLRFPSAELPVGRHVLLARGTVDGVVDAKAEGGRRTLVGPVAKRNLNIRPPAVAVIAPKAAPPTTGSIAGVVLRRGNPRSGETVTIPGVGSAVSDGAGKFRFDDVPPGPYAVGVESTRFAGNATATVVAGATANVEVRLEAK